MRQFHNLAYALSRVDLDSSRVDLKLTMLGQRTEESRESRTLGKGPDQLNCDLNLRNTRQVVVSVSRKSLQYLQNGICYVGEPRIR